MKTLTAAMQTHLEAPAQTLATIIKITRTDGEVLALTTHISDLVVDGVTYSAGPLDEPTAVTQHRSLEVASADARVLFAVGGLAEAELVAGYYDGAVVEVSQVNYLDIATCGRIKLLKGRLGQVQLGRGHAVVTLLGLSSLLQQPIGELYSATCRCREVGDSRCLLTIAADNLVLGTPGWGTLATGTVTGVTNRTTFADSARTEPADFFTYGKFTWLTGDNAGLVVAVKSYTAATGTFVLERAMPYAIQVGDTFQAEVGCNRTTARCIALDNMIHYRGEPHLPGRDAILHYGPRE